MHYIMIGHESDFLFIYYYYLFAFKPWSPCREKINLK